MKLLLQSIKIIDKKSPYHLKTQDVLVENGLIQKIAKNIPVEEEYKVFKEKNAFVSPAWIDTNMHIFEPGHEYREDFKSGLRAAAKGGFGAVCIMPNTNPSIDSNTQVSFIKGQGHLNLTQVFPYGAISQKINGKDLAEIYDMYQSGAVAFTDGNVPVNNAGLMERALLYVKKFKGLILSNPENTDVAAHGQMNEGVMSTKLGLQGVPKLAEELMVARDLYLVEHTKSRVHFTNISTKKSVSLIRKAKARGLKVTAGVNVANIFFEDSVLSEYETNYKVHPHLRGKSDVKALIKGLADGTIDVIASGHTPMHIDEKKVEFENAEFGVSTIDSVFAAARTVTVEALNVEELVDKLINGYKVLGKESPEINEGAKAQMTVFNVSSSNKFSKDAILSKGKNNPFVGLDLLGKAYGVINGNKTNIL